MNLLRKILIGYAKSWAFVLWSVFCVLVGAAWMFADLVAVLAAQGIHL